MEEINKLNEIVTSFPRRKERSFTVTTTATTGA